MAQAPFANGSYRTPGSVDTGTISAPRMTNAGEVVGQGLMQAGQMIGQVGDQIDHQRKIQQAQDNVAATQDAMNQFRQHVRTIQYGDPDDPQTPGFLTLQGKAAMDGWKGASSAVDDARKNIMSGLSIDQQKMFDRESSDYQNSALTAMGAHVGQQRESYQNQTYKATLSNLTDQGAANLDNPSVFAGSLNRGRATVMQQLGLRGVPLDSPVAQAELQAYNDQYLTTAVKASVDGGKAIQGMSLLQANQRNMSAPAYQQAFEQIQPHVWREQGDMLGRSVSNPGGVQSVPSQADPDATFGAMVHLESGGNQTDAKGAPVTSSKGAVGTAQLMPATAKEVAQSVGLQWDESRFKTDGAYNRALGQAYFQELCQKYGNNLTLACAAYNAGPGNVDKWRKEFGDPSTGAISDQDFVAQIPFKETQNYVSRTGAAVNQASPAPSFNAPDLSAQVSKVHGEALRLGLAPEAEARALSVVHQNYSEWQQSTATARSHLQDHVQDLSAAYMQGNTQQDVPAQQIRQLYEPEQAQNVIQDLTMRRQAGIQYADLKWASPQQIQQVQQSDSHSLQGEDTDHYQARMKIVSMRNQMIDKRNQALLKDPASFVSDNPNVQQAAQQVDPEKPETFQQYAQTVMAVQRNLGVQQPRILTDDQVHQAVQTLTNVDPAKQDVVPVLNGLEQQYGQLWPQAFGEMVRVGKMPAEYQVLANMDTTAQAGGRQMYAANLKVSLADLAKNPSVHGVSLEKSSLNGDPVSDQMAPFLATTELQGGGGAINNLAQDAIKRQAYGYMSRGMTKSDAVSTAYNDIIGAKYDTYRTIRAPKGELPAVQSATGYVLSRLKASDIQVASDLDGIPDNERATYTLERARRLGQWVMNGDESGYNLVMPLRSPGQYRTLMNRDGSPLTVTLKGIRSGQYANPYDDNALKLSQQAQQAYIAQHPEGR
ncbi:transglycosylase SLT domain-containing protein [Gluconobacter cerinus]|uniref:transglycosylase SLT domain-containing protein n=1 Tax=Gluconobacter cerinus TaxID=38307 RepID=UPI00193FCE45|nr:transglycosylase SLT domain-containing protein [Gluconobacter cerinus]MBM3099129.1 transglycosylase SLT domain-containing protein [Gluconobacter cerinus]